VSALRHDYDPPERFVAGAIGRPGDRTFYVQARAAGRATADRVEKVQLALLAERIEDLLSRVRRAGATVDPGTVGAEDVAPPPGAVVVQPPPVVEDFRAEVLSLGWDAAHSRVVIEARGPADAVGDVPSLRVHLTAPMARGFAVRARRVIAAGRAPCPFCGLPLDPDGHLCPRANGSHVA
jgi:uncharacterized repeat protein (TIGR03847 family)